jgi:hypothetical protein
MPNAPAPMEKPDLPELYEKEFLQADMEIIPQKLVDKYGTSNPAELKSRIVQSGLRELSKKEGRPDMMDGGMAKGKGGKTYQHNYATGGSVVDNLKPIPADNKGLPNLPKSVRNKMGFMKKGGMVKGRGSK